MYRAGSTVSFEATNGTPCMHIADSFIPTAGVDGLLPIVTYFFFVVATYAFLSFFVFALVARPTTALTAQSPLTNLSFFLTAGVAVAGLSYYLIQGYYHTMLAELATVTDIGDRQTLIREAYNAIGQYRYMAWAITVPLLLLKIVSLLKIPAVTRKKTLLTLLPASFFMILVGYVGHEQLSFDNEIQTGPKLIWGAVSMAGYGLISLTLYRLWKQVNSTVQPDGQRIYRLVVISFGTFWLTYPVGYILTLTPIDFNWIHILYTLADVISLIGIGLLPYFVSMQSSEITH